MEKFTDIVADIANGKEYDKDSVLLAAQVIRHLMAGSVSNIRLAAKRLPADKYSEIIARDIATITEILKSID